MAEDFNARLDRLENMMIVLTEARIKFGEHLNRVEQQSRERGQALDGRVDKLVSAIGEFIRQRDGGVN